MQLFKFSIGSNSVLAAFEPVVVLEHEAVIGGFKCLYHITKREQAHHTNYPAILELAELLGCEYFKKLKVSCKGKCCHYIILFYISNFEIFDLNFLRLGKIPTTHLIGVMFNNSRTTSSLVAAVLLRSAHHHRLHNTSS